MLAFYQSSFKLGEDQVLSSETDWWKEKNG